MGIRGKPVPGSRFGVRGCGNGKAARGRRPETANHRQPRKGFGVKLRRIGIRGRPVPPTDCTTETQRGVAATKVVEAAKMRRIGIRGKAALQWQGGGARQAARQPRAAPKGIRGKVASNRNSRQASNGNSRRACATRGGQDGRPTNTRLTTTGRDACATRPTTRRGYTGGDRRVDPHQRLLK